ncbi:MAG: helix-turn-helix domain-containing protein [Opitutales bacterium]
MTMPALDSFFDRDLWDLLDDVAFWVKDREGRFVWVNLTLAEQARATREAVIGTRDSDWFFNELASVYMADDAALVAGGAPLRNKPELVMDPDGGVGWYVTSKFPLVERGRIAGTYGMSRPMEAGASLPAEYADLSGIVSHARARLADGMSVEALAKEAHMSLSTLERTVRRHLRITPRELLRRIRMNRARHLLTTSALQVGEIALACGYESFSSFSRAFRQTYGCAPGGMKGGGGEG